LEPLAFVAAILGAGGLGVILKIVLASSGSQQRSFNQALQDQRNSYQDVLSSQRREFEEFLNNNIRNTAQGTVNALEALAKSIETTSELRSAEHAALQQQIRDQEARVREAHRGLARILSLANPSGREVAKAIDDVFEENGDA
jgi:ABC-type uncharacterized transport system ATPase component